MDFKITFWRKKNIYKILISLLSYFEMNAFCQIMLMRAVNELWNGISFFCEDKSRYAPDTPSSSQVYMYWLKSFEIILGFC